MQNINLKAVVRLTGVNQNTLRAWERRYGTIKPARSKDGRRLYSGEDVERIRLLWSLVHKGHIIGQIIGLRTPQLRQILEGSDEILLAATRDSLSPSRASEDHKAESKYLEQILIHLEKFELSPIHQLLQRARFELSPKQIISNVLLPLLREVGLRVAARSLSISQEHILSSLLRDYLGTVYQSLSPFDYSSGQNPRQRVCLTTREGDIHEFGVLIAAILCRINNLETYYLGPNMPAEDLANACSHFSVDSVILGMATLPQTSKTVSARRFIEDLDAMLPKKVRLLLGGPATKELIDRETGQFKSVLKSQRQLLRFSSLEEMDQYLARAN